MNSQRKKQLNKIAQDLKTKSGKDFQDAVKAVAISLDVSSQTGWSEFSHIIYCQFKLEDRINTGMIKFYDDNSYTVHLPDVILGAVPKL
tara:strand:- start:345 stop:611 length:267 start_codon:yes stop_codon:yes gene_type:complete